jgi:hypothetical protein
MKLTANAIATTALFVLVGCGGGDKWTKNLPETVIAAGYITLDGEPIAAASIVGHPTGDNTHACSDLSDSSGYFELTAFPSKGGVVPGSYQISVTRTVEVEGAVGGVLDLGEDADHATGDEGDTTGLQWINDLPVKYANAINSGLTIDVPADGTEDLKLELTSN